MQVGGWIHGYVMDVLSSSVMQEQFDSTAYYDARRPTFKKYIMNHDVSVSLLITFVTNVYAAALHCITLFSYCCFVICQALYATAGTDVGKLKKMISEPIMPCRMEYFHAVSRIIMYMSILLSVLSRYFLIFNLFIYRLLFQL